MHITEKGALRIVNNAGYHEHTSKLFLTLNALKLRDLVEFKPAQVMCKASKLLPGKIQKLLMDREEGRLRENLVCSNTVRTDFKSMCFSICGVILWNDLDENKQGKNNIFMKYRGV